MRKAHWVVIGRQDCKWCDEVKSLLLSKGVTFTYHDIEKASGLASFLVDSGLTTVPQVYLDGERVGGYEATKLWFVEEGL